MMVKVTFIHHSAEGMLHASVASPFLFEDLSSVVDDVSMLPHEGLSHVVIDRDNRCVIQAGGYDADRGLYIETFGGNYEKIVN